MKYILIAVVSKDGFIARNSRHLPMEWTSKEEKSHFKKSINNCDWSVMGRNTHELFYNENSANDWLSRINQMYFQGKTKKTMDKAWYEFGFG